MSNRLAGKKDNAKNRTERQIAEGLTVGMEKAASVYVALMFMVFPLFITDKYYNCLKDKYYFFFYATALLVAAVLFLFLAGKVMGAYRRRGSGKLFAGLSLTDRFMLLFLISCTLSTVFSEWRFEAFWGNMGRLQGLFFYLLIGASYFAVTRTYRFKRRHLYMFLAAGIVVCLWGVLDYLGVDPLGWRADAGDYWSMLAFTSTIGNVNTFTAIAALYFGVSAYLSVKSRKPWFFIVSFFISSLALITGQSDNAFLAVAVTFMALPFVLFENRKGTVRYLMLVSLFLLALSAVGLLTSVWTATRMLYRGSWGMLLKIANGYTKYCAAAAVVSAALACLLRFSWKKDITKKTPGLRTVWGALCAAVFVSVIYVFIDANSGRHEEFWKPFESVLVINESWGTYRGYAWKRTFEFFREFPVMKKLFGSGPETYSIFMAENFYYEMLERSNTVFDSPHSEPIQMLFTTGIIGFISYYGTFVTAFIKGIRGGTWQRACAFAVLAYFAASLINISVPITTPLFFLLMELCLTNGDGDEEKA